MKTSFKDTFGLYTLTENVAQLIYLEPANCSHQSVLCRSLPIICTITQTLYNTVLPMADAFVWFLVRLEEHSSNDKRGGGGGGFYLKLKSVPYPF